MKWPSVLPRLGHCHQISAHLVAPQLNSGASVVGHSPRSIVLVVDGAHKQPARYHLRRAHVRLTHMARLFSR